MGRPVKSKKDFVKRFLADEFGNRGQNWNTIKEWLASKYKGPVHIRNRVAGGPTYYDIPYESVIETWDSVTRAKLGSFYLAAMAPHHHNLLQGEVQINHHGLYLYAGVGGTWPMRDTLKYLGQEFCGLQAKMLLKSRLCANSYEWLMYLLEEYDEHIVEFSTFSVDWGTQSGYNTVYWEVRQY